EGRPFGDYGRAVRRQRGVISSYCVGSQFHRNEAEVMNPNLKWKVVAIALVIALCIFGLVGLPSFPTSIAQLRDNFGQRIKLGLDLQGGTHLILQVQVNEAVNGQTQQTLDHLKTDLQNKSIHYDDILQPVNSDDTILVRNVAPDSSAGFSDLVSS